jgi:Domain of unknown function (DUF4352)
MPGPPPAPKSHRMLKVIGGITAAIIVLGVIGAIAGGGSDSTSAVTSTTGATSTTGTQAKTVAKAKAKAKATKTSPGIGTRVRDGKFSFTVTKLTHKSTVGAAPMAQKAQGRFTLVYVTVENIGTKPQTLDGSSQELYDQQGRKFDSDTGAAIFLPDSNSFLEAINPGNTVKGILVYDLPTTAVPTKLEVHDSPFSGGADISLK